MFISDLSDLVVFIYIYSRSILTLCYVLQYFHIWNANYKAKLPVAHLICVSVATGVSLVDIRLLPTSTLDFYITVSEILLLQLHIG